MPRHHRRYVCAAQPVEVTTTNPATSRRFRRSRFDTAMRTHLPDRGSLSTRKEAQIQDGHHRKGKGRTGRQGGKTGRRVPRTVDPGSKVGLRGKEGVEG
jgi:hypothetical protein